MAAFVPSSCLVAPRWRQKVFSVAARDYVGPDIFQAAMLSDEWRPFEQSLIEVLACVAEARSLDRWPEEARIDEAASEFRYARDLITGDEIAGWLKRNGVSLDDW